MSSLRNAVKRITHKERSQPRARAHLGLLEKKKDYVVRAKDYHKKKERLSAMRSKAASRNPDEFYFGMQRSQVNKQGKHVQTEEAKLKDEELQNLIGDDAVRIMKDQDVSYVRMQMQRDASQVQKLESSLHLMVDDKDDDDDNEVEDGDDTSKKKKRQKRNHTIFLRDKTQAETFDMAKHFDTAPETVGRTFNRPRLSALARLHDAVDIENDDYYNDDDNNKQPLLTDKQLEKLKIKQRKLAKKTANARSGAYTELERRKKRMATLELAERHLIVEKHVQSKGMKRKIQEAENGKPAVYKWRRKRTA